ncbi:nucleotidyltransferase domain-containing protein [Exiguobacterium antarcticum]|uniref:Nucleotidyltransferase domain-containing protein n=1 Tax=Exiguobacterium antarcticum TaxID=132920 RepID=A0ABT6R4P9_9BACL|nr:nucleotidyltransferase domain-containing protein [Exiguobacterium antarcticum]MDI3235752.1 nucleotidyltransferase domain-containing protein [Exiguobacterium antarcticum]
MSDQLSHAKQISRLIIESRYPDCDAALLAGSFVRGQATATSDLDLIVFCESVPASYRESFTFDEFPVEAFIHSSTTIRDFFRQDCERGRPSMQKMVTEGLVLRDHALLAPLKAQAQTELLAGPPVLSLAEADRARYFLTDLLDDFIGVTDRMEGLGIAARLLEQATDFRLRTSGHWTGQGKWLIRSLAIVDPVEAKRLTDAFEVFFRMDKKQPVIDLVEQWLDAQGGRHFEGFSIGK